MSDAAILVPQFILQHYEAGTRSGAFMAAGLFVDISGFSTVTSTLMGHGSEAAEDMATIMTNIWEPLVDIVLQQGGIIAGFAGDALTALFPIAEGAQTYDVSCQALWAAHLIQKHLAENPTQASRYGTFPFAIKLGMDIGQTEWGIIEPEEGSASFYFSGPVVDGAAAAEHHAEKGFLVLSEGVARILDEHIRTQSLADGYVRVLRILLDAPLSQPKSAFIPQPTTYDAFVPAHIQSKAEKGEFRPIITVFINVMGVDTHAQLTRFMEAIFAIRARYGGYISGIDFGDKGCNILLFWGMPTAYPNDLDRALSFLLDLAIMTPGTFKAGLTLRTMYAGFTGSSKRGEYTCYGTGVNLAARLMMAAPWGEFWLEEKIAAQALDHYTLAERGEHLFKGFEQPQPAKALVNRRSKSAIFQGDMAGRGAELTRIERFLAPLSANSPSPGMLVVEADAGMGKSRLVYEARSLSHVQQHAQIGLGQTDELVHAPMGPFRYWLIHYFEQSPTHSDEHNKQQFNRKLNVLITLTSDEHISQELNRLRSCLGALVGLHWANSLYAELDPEARHNTSFVALRHFIQALCEQKPLILIIEDLHWLDAESKQFIDLILLVMEEKPFAILATQRPTTIDWADGLTIDTINLNTLAPEDLARIAENILEGPIHADLLDLLNNRSEGNPFFAEQIIRYLRETERIIHQEDDTWHLIDDSTDLSLPADIRSLFTARLDVLTAEVKEVVQTASILGREFEVRLLSRMLQGNVSHQVETASDEAIWMALDELHYMFQHALLRDAAYHMQLQARRRELHRLAAEGLQSLYGDDTEEVIQAVAYHLAAAVEQGLEDLRSDAVTALTRAGHHLAENFDNPAAEEHFSRAIDLHPAEDDTLLALLLAREAILNLLGKRDEQGADLDRLEALTADHGPTEQRIEIALRRINWLEADAQREAVITTCQAAIDMARQLNLLAAEAQILVRMADSHRELAMPEIATQALEKAMELAEAIGDHTIRADALNSMSFLYLNQGVGVKAVQAQREALAIYDAIDDTVGQLRVLKMLGFTYRYLGEYEDCIDTYSRALKIAEHRGDAAGLANALNGLSNIYTDIGQFEQAREYANRANTLMRELQNTMSLFYVKVFEGFVALLATDYAQAVEQLSEAIEIGEGTQAQMPIALAKTYLSEALTALGRWDEAIAHYEAARQVIEGHNIQDLVVENHIRTAVAYIYKGQHDAARQHMAHVEAFLAGGRHLAETEYPIQLHLLMAQIYAALGEIQQAHHFADKAIDDLFIYRDKLTNPAYQESFVTNLPWNRKVMALHQAKHVGKDILPMLAFTDLEASPQPIEGVDIISDEAPTETSDEHAPFPPLVNVDLQTAIARIAYLEGRIATLEELRQQDRKELAELNRALGHAEATIEQLKNSS